MPQPSQTPSDIYPCLTYTNALASIEWLCKVFGFTQRLVVPGPDGRILHAELSFGSGVIIVSSIKPEVPQGANSSICVFVEDPDSHHRTATAAGATIVRPLRLEEYGARGYAAVDPEGHLWYFGNYKPGALWKS